MNDQNALIKELDQKLAQYMEEENYEKVDEVSRQLCRLQGFEPAEEMPDVFVHRLKKEVSAMEKHKGNKAIKASKRAAGIAAAAAVFLLLGGTVSAAVLYNKGINIFEYGLSTAGEVETPESESPSPFRDADLPDVPDTTTVLSTQQGSSDHAWVEKKVYEEDYTVYDSPDAENWTPFTQTNHVTEYRYENYYAAALDAGFEQLLSTDYEGETFYYIYEHMDKDGRMKEDEPADLSISGRYAYGNGSFALSQYPGNEENTEFAVITNETGNNREYISSTGCLFALTDDRDETGRTRTHTLVKCDNYFLTLEFTGMSEEEIHAVLETVRLKDNS